MNGRLLIVCGLLLLPLVMFGQGACPCSFTMYRSLPVITDTSQLYFRAYITRNVQYDTNTGKWQIREDTNGGSWRHWAADTNRSRARANAGNFEPYGFVWQNNDTFICIFEFEIDSSLATHKGYYAGIALRLTGGNNADSARTCTLRAIPKPTGIGQPYPPRLEWQKAPYDTSVIGSRLAFNPILGYSIFRSLFATGPWTRCDPEGSAPYQPYTDTIYYDSTAPPNTPVYYSIRLVYHPVKVIGQDTTRIESRLSEISNLVNVGIAGSENHQLNRSEFRLTIRPNPASRKVDINYQISDNSQAALKIYSINGRMIRQYDHLALKLSNRIVWDRRDNEGIIVPNGVYFISLKTKDSIITRKLILE